MSNFNRVVAAAALVLTAACSKGGSETSEDPGPTYSLCGRDITQLEFLRYLDQTYVIAASHSEDGRSSAELLTGLIVSMLVNGIDFDELSSNEIAFSGGSYQVSSSQTKIGFKLYDSETGDLITENMFDVDSYFRNVDVTVALPPAYTFTPGPLYDYLESDVPTAGEAADFVGKKVHLDTSRIDFELDSVNSKDELKIKMTSTRANIETVSEEIAAGEFGFSYDGTFYASADGDVRQTFEDSEFLIQADGTGSYWDGTYQSTLTKGGFATYLSGMASNRASPNTTDYFCDAERTAAIGRIKIYLEEGIPFGYWTFDFADGGDELSSETGD